MSQITNLQMSAAASGAVTSLTGNAGGAVLPDGGGNIDVLGDGTIVTVTGTPASNLLTWTVDVDAITDYVTDSGTAEPSGGVLNVLGGDVINTSGSGDTLTVNVDSGLDGQLIIGATGGNAEYGYLTSPTNTIVFGIGTNTLSLDVDIVATGAIIEIIPDSGTSPVVSNAGGGVSFTGDTTGLTFVGGTNEVSVSGTLVVANGGTGATTLTDHGVLVGSGTGAVTALTVGTNGQVLVGATGADPAMATLTSADGSIVFATGANTLDLTVDAAASGGVDGLIPDSGTSPVVPDGSGDITIAGGSNINTAGGANTLTINLDDAVSVVTSLTSPAINLTGATQYAVAVYGSSGALSEVSGVGTSGQVLTSNGAGSNPTWQDTGWGNLTVTELDNTDSTYTVLSTDEVLSCDVSSGTLAIDLPNSTDTGRRIFIKDNSGNANTNNITLSTPGGTVTIDGSTSYAMNTDYQSVLVLFDGTNYIIL